jgi:hypothetical protein
MYGEWLVESTTKSGWWIFRNGAYYFVNPFDNVTHTGIDSYSIPSKRGMQQVSKTK